jgi:hypothetical protein
VIPQIKRAFNRWQSDITMIKVAETVVDYEVVETETEFTFKGVVQPLAREELKAKPEGERSWEWLMIHTYINIELETGDKIKYQGKDFKVMAKKDYELNNYYEYHIVKDYE